MAGLTCAASPRPRARSAGLGPGEADEASRPPHAPQRWTDLSYCSSCAWCFYSTVFGSSVLPPSTSQSCWSNWDQGGEFRRPGQPPRIWAEIGPHWTSDLEQSLRSGQSTTRYVWRCRELCSHPQTPAGTGVRARALVLDVVHLCVCACVYLCMRGKMEEEREGM